MPAEARHRRRAHPTRPGAPHRSGLDHTQRGQATVELALTIPVVVACLLSVVQVGLVVRDKVLVVHAAREAARAAAVEPATGAAQQAAHVPGLDPGRLRVAVGPEREPGSRLTVTITYQAPTRVPLVGRLVGDVGLRAAVTTRVE